MEIIIRTRGTLTQMVSHTRSDRRIAEVEVMWAFEIFLVAPRFNLKFKSHLTLCDGDRCYGV